ncbi:hypothetical protein [Brevibacterium zhoupengii]|uniref:hypothetical protein n=1 Tax=Brevibacterium zhoupengii TaxID=2898795 RepID=UPI001F08A4FC|nr:hypothetical protein [Brevibacterium zhoupengii]
MIRDEVPGPLQSVEESSLSFPAGATKAEKTRLRLEAIEHSGRLVIGRGPRGSHITRVVLSVMLGLLGLLVLVLGAEGFVALAGFVFFGVFSFVVPIVITKRYGQDHRLELTPDRFELIRIEKDVEATVEESWANVTRVTTVSSGHQPASPQFPVVDVFSSTGARSGFSLFSGDPHGARIVFNQQLEVGRWELYELLDAAHQRFRPQDEGATGDQH